MLEEIGVVVAIAAGQLTHRADVDHLPGLEGLAEGRLHRASSAASRSRSVAATRPAVSGRSSMSRPAAVQAHGSNDLDNGRRKPPPHGGVERTR